MIGVAANADDLRVAKEFFELFKTQWEPAVPAKKYDVVLSVDEPIAHLTASSFLVFGSQVQSADRDAGVTVEHANGLTDVSWATITFPIFGRTALFDADGGVLTCEGRRVDYRSRSEAGPVHRIGYDLFAEIRYLLTEGQPASRAVTPTLDLHIALLRHLLQDLRVPFLEILPRPEGYDFVCCLTHDVDFFGIRRHMFDRTLFGFAGRASVGTLVDLVRGRRSLLEAIRNWAALLSLPLVFLRLLPDFWDPFEDYATAEKDRRSTFFLIPFKGRPGVGPDGTTHPVRSAPYQMSDIRRQASDVCARGHELAVHGIDAWRDVNAGRAELAEVTAVTGATAAGVRMHWLYFAHDSAQLLEEAGFAYDSTWGYNDAVGYRAGTSQVFRLSGSESLLELPLSIMDSALFYPGRMDLTSDEALRRCRAIVAHARRFGGTVVINWHDRSLAPERLWGRCYRELLAEVGDGTRAWFATAGDAVDWFRWRRSIHFSAEVPGIVTIAASSRRRGLPGAQIAIHRPASGHDGFAIEERRFDDEGAMRLSL